MWERGGVAAGREEGGKKEGIPEFYCLFANASRSQQVKHPACKDGPDPPSKIVALLSFAELGLKKSKGEDFFISFSCIALDHMFYEFFRGWVFVPYG